MVVSFFKKNLFVSDRVSLCSPGGPQIPGVVLNSQSPACFYLLSAGI